MFSSDIHEGKYDFLFPPNCFVVDENLARGILKDDCWWLNDMPHLIKKNFPETLVSTVEIWSFDLWGY